VAAALGAPWLAPYPAARQLQEQEYAPPTRVHVFDGGRPSLPFIRRTVQADPLTRTFTIDAGSHVPLRWFHQGRVVGTDDDRAPVLLLGADGLGRDLFSRLVFAARRTLAIAAAAVALSLLVGSVVGLVAGYAGGTADQVLMRLADAAVVMPVLYVVLALRSALPLTLSPGEISVLAVAVFTLVCWPMTARGVRALVAAERGRDYVTAARAAGAGPIWILTRHLAPATAGFVVTQGVLLLPTIVIAETTLSFAGLGLPDADPGLGTLLNELGNVLSIEHAPWLLAPAVALFLFVVALNLAFDRTTAGLPGDTPVDATGWPGVPPRARAS
jgi:peptide/nickel transport system permease protein